VMSPDVNIDPTRIPWLSDFDSTKYAIYPGMRAKEQGWQKDETPAKKAKVKLTNRLSVTNIRLRLK